MDYDLSISPESTMLLLNAQHRRRVVSSRRYSRLDSHGTRPCDAPTRDENALSAPESRTYIASHPFSPLAYLHGPCGGVAQRADRVPLDLLGQLPHHVDLGRLRLAIHETPHHLVEPIAALTTGRALQDKRGRLAKGKVPH